MRQILSTPQPAATSATYPRLDKHHCVGTRLIMLTPALQRRRRPTSLASNSYTSIWQIPVLWTPLRFQVGPEVNVFKRAVNT